jgi:hypothetical protein
MLEDDITFEAVYDALTQFERSLTLRGCFQASIGHFFQRSVRVRFRKDELLAEHAARLILKMFNFLSEPMQLAQLPE